MKKNKKNIVKETEKPEPYIYVWTHELCSPELHRISRQDIHFHLRGIIEKLWNKFWRCIVPVRDYVFDLSYQKTMEITSNSMTIWGGTNNVTRLRKNDYYFEDGGYFHFEGTKINKEDLLKLGITEHISFNN
jgi:hypothetical protein